MRKEGEDALLYETTPLSRCLDAEREFFWESAKECSMLVSTDSETYV